MEYATSTAKRTRFQMMAMFIWHVAIKLFDLLGGTDSIGIAAKYIIYMVVQEVERLYMGAISFVATIPVLQFVSHMRRTSKTNLRDVGGVSLGQWKILRSCFGYKTLQG